MRKILYIILLGSLFLLGPWFYLHFYNFKVDSNEVQNSQDDLITPINSESIQWDIDGKMICNESTDQMEFKIISDGMDGAIIVWIDSRNGNSDIFAQRIDSSGATLWEDDGIPICAMPGEQQLPQIISDNINGAFIIWQDYRDSGSDLYCQHLNSNGDFLWEENGRVISNEINSQYNPIIIPDGLNGVIITWMDTRNGGNDIYAQRMNSTGEFQWNPNGTAICTATGTQYEQCIAVDGQGGAFIAWTDYRGGMYTDLYCQRINGSGTVKFTNNGIPIGTEANDQFFPSIISDGEGGAIISWVDTRTATGDIYAQRINYLGTALWGYQGKPICTAENDQNDHFMITDDEGGAIIVWQDERSGTQPNIYGQRVNEIGTCLWDNDGVAICNAINDQQALSLSGDNANGVIVVWEDLRNGGFYEVYAQRINSTGSPKWGMNGELISSGGSYNQYLPQIIPDNKGGAIVIWLDQRSGTNDDIYGQKIKNFDPLINHPNDLTCALDSSQSIIWKITDDQGCGKYRISVRDPLGDIYTWVQWNSWVNNTNIPVTLNTSVSGIFEYQIEYYDDQGIWGISDIVVVTVESNSSTDKPDTIGVDPVNFYLLILSITGGTAIFFVGLVIYRKRQQNKIVGKLDEAFQSWESKENTKEGKL